MNLKKLERRLWVNMLGPGPRLMKKEFTGPRSHKGWETLPYSMYSVFWFQKVVHKFRAPCRPHFCILPNISSTIIAVFTLHTKCLPFHTHPTECGRQFAGVTPKLWGSSVCNGLHVTLLAPRIWNWILDWKICGPLLLEVFRGCCWYLLSVQDFTECSSVRRFN